MGSIKILQGDCQNGNNCYIYYDIKYKYQQRNMNSKKVNLIPSPRSRHARKPIIDLSNFQSHSLDRDRTGEKAHNLNSSLDNKKLTQNINKYELRENRPQNNQHLLYQPSHVCCKNHRDRKAVSYMEKKLIQYLCFQCSLYEARAGCKIKTIKSSQINANHNGFSYQRKQELQNYIKNAEQTQNKSKIYIKYLKQSLYQHIQSIQLLVKNFSTQLQQQIAALTKFYEKRKQEILKIRQKQMKEIIPYIKQIQDRLTMLACNRLDVLNNFQQCMNFFSQKQYGTVMKKYWKQIEDMKAEVKNNYSMTIFQNFKLQINQLLNSLQSTKVDDRQFTFSKSRNFQTPKQQLKFRNVPLINSNSKSIKMSPKQKSKHDMAMKGSYNQLVSSFRY